MIFSTTDSNAMDLYQEAQLALGHFFAQLPKEVEDLAYEFRDLVMKRSAVSWVNYETTETVRVFFRDPKTKYATYGSSVDRKFVVQIKAETHSIYHNDSETIYTLQVSESNPRFSIINNWLLPWERKK